LVRSESELLPPAPSAIKDWHIYRDRRAALDDSDFMAALDQGPVLCAIRNYYGGYAVNIVTG
jgi:hypothetical protein